MVAVFVWFIVISHIFNNQAEKNTFGLISDSPKKKSIRCYGELIKTPESLNYKCAIHTHTSCILFSIIPYPLSLIPDIISLQSCETISLSVTNLQSPLWPPILPFGLAKMLLQHCQICDDDAASKTIPNIAL